MKTLMHISKNASFMDILRAPSETVKNTRDISRRVQNVSEKLDDQNFEETLDNMNQASRDAKYVTGDVRQKWDTLKDVGKKSAIGAGVIGGAGLSMGLGALGYKEYQRRKQKPEEQQEQRRLPPAQEPQYLPRTLGSRHERAY